MSSKYNYTVEVAYTNCNAFPKGIERVECGYMGHENGRDSFAFTNDGFSLSLSRYLSLSLDRDLDHGSLSGQILKGLLYSVALSESLPAVRSVSMTRAIDYCGADHRRRSRRPEFLAAFNRPLLCDSALFAVEKRSFPFGADSLSVIFQESEKAVAVRGALLHWLAALAQPDRYLMLLRLWKSVESLASCLACRKSADGDTALDLIDDLTARSPLSFPRTHMLLADGPLAGIGLSAALRKARGICLDFRRGLTPDSAFRLKLSALDSETDALNSLLKSLVYELIQNHHSF